MKYESRKDAEEAYRDVLVQAREEGCGKEAMARLGKSDLYFLLTRLLNRKDIQHDWLFDRCQEVQAEPNNCLDLWAREHYKSTIITYGLTIQDILNDPEICIGIFSISRPIAKAFLEQIKWELETNEPLKELYPDVLFKDPKKEAPKWTLDDGIIVKRKSNPKERTVEAHGFIEGLPTSRHYHIRLYDDMIDEKLVTNSDIIKKVVERWQVSLNLGSKRILPRYGVANVARYVGTRYKYSDVYGHLIEKKIAKVRLHPGTEDGTPTGKPVLMPVGLMNQKREEMGAYVFACQILMNPKADEINGYNIEDVQYWWPDMVNTAEMNIYLIVDPASKKKTTSDRTSMKVLGLHTDNNVYLLDGIVDRLSLSERTTWLFRLHRKWRPIKTGYEEYGLQCDIEHIKEKMDEENHRFTITPLKGKLAKESRIEKFIPVVEAQRYWVPFKCVFTDYERRPQDLIRIHLQEMDDYPVGLHDDTIDCVSRIKDPDLGAEFPELDILPYAEDTSMAKTEYSLFG